jgi:pyridoxine kinase
LFLFHMLRTGRPEAAMAEAASAIHGLLKRTRDAGSRELLTVAAQDEFINPSNRFLAMPA